MVGRQSLKLLFPLKGLSWFESKRVCQREIVNLRRTQQFFLEITCFWLLVIKNASCKLKSRGSLLGAKSLQIQPTQAQALGRRQNRPQTVANQIQGARTLYIGSRAKLTYGRARTIEWAALQKPLRKHIVGLNPNRPCQPHPLVSRLLKMGGDEVSQNLSGIGTI